MSTDNSSMNESNMASLELSEKVELANYSCKRDKSIHLVIDDDLLSSLGGQIPGLYKIVPMSSLDSASLLESISAGDSLLWIGKPEGIPQDLWVGSFVPADADLRVSPASGSPLILDDPGFKPSKLSSAYIKPVKEMLAHNIDEEVRADFIPVLHASDRFGKVIGYPGVLMNYYAPSLAGGRFSGSQCFFYLFDEPCNALGSDGWLNILTSIASRFTSGVQIKRVETDYASYKPGERVRVRVKLANHRSISTAVEVRFYTRAPGDSDFRKIVSHRRCPDAYGESEAVADFVVNGDQGLHMIRVEVCQDPEHAVELAILGNPILVDRRDIGIVLIDGQLKTPSIMEIDGPSITIDGQSAFLAGTHYYPSSSWWEWVWRDFRPLNAARDFAGIRNTGYRIARIWIDPILDEQTLRAMDAAVYLASQSGIILDVCVFTQWVRTIGFERPNGEHVAFDFRAPRDFNVYSISLRNMALQKEYMQVMASRWKDAGNVMYNLANETYIKDPDESQMDPESPVWKELPSENGSLRNSMVFRLWAREITSAIRETGANQPVLPGYMFSLSDGGDNFIGNRDGDIMPWHCYLGSLTAVTLTYFDAACSNKPTILEEFGINGWNTPDNYDANVHFALGTGAAAAMSYEWGVSWLSPEMCFCAMPLRESIDQEVDPRWFGPAVDIAKTWPSNGVGICATPSGFGYGSIYHGTPFPAEAAVALGRLGLMGKNLGRENRPEKAYLVIPTAVNDKMDPFFEVIKALWKANVVFGVWHEDCLPDLPDTAQVLIVPFVSPSLETKLDELASKGIDIITNVNVEWKSIPELPVIQVSPGDEIDLMIRRTKQGTLYSLVSETYSDTVSIDTEGKHNVSLGIKSYAMAHESGNGISMIEGSGDVIIDGVKFCSISNGRAIIASDDGNDLINAKTLRILSTEPSTIIFNRDVKSGSICFEGGEKSSAALGNDYIKGAALNVDSEMFKYVIEIYPA
ncbi:MAG: glycoside hydrolase 5 family protein [Armatimonadota bacterium]